MTHRSRGQQEKGHAEQADPGPALLGGVWRGKAVRVLQFGCSLTGNGDNACRAGASQEDTSVGLRK